MRTLYIKALGLFFAICGIPPADAEDGLPLRQRAPNAATLPATLTGKERLGKKWMDEQRIDNLQRAGRQARDKAATERLPGCPDGLNQAITHARLNVTEHVSVAAGRRCRDQWDSV